MIIDFWSGMISKHKHISWAQKLVDILLSMYLIICIEIANDIRL